MELSNYLGKEKYVFSLIIDDQVIVLDRSPERWNAQEFSNSRDMTFLGVIRTYTTELQFVSDGAKIIRQQFYTNGVDADVKILIQSLNNSTGLHEEMYRGDLDFSTFEDSLNYVQINAIDSGIAAKIQAYRSVKYEIPFAPEDVTLTMPGVDAQEWFTIFLAGIGFRIYQNAGGAYIPSTSIGNSEILLNSVIVFPQVNESIFYRDNSGDEQQIDFTNAKGFSFDVAKSISTGVQLSGTVNITARQGLNVSGGPTPNTGWSVLLVDNTSSTGGNPIELVNTLLTSPPENGVIQDRDYDISASFVPVIGRKYFIIVRPIGSQNLSINYLNINNGTIRGEYKDVSSETFVRAMRPKRLLNAILNKINSDIPIEIWSPILDSNQGYLITCGDALRVFENPVIKTSLDDFFKSFDALLSTGFGITKGVPIFNSKSYFFDYSEVIAELGSITDCKISPMTDLMYSKITAGYGKYDYEISGGKQEYNNGQEYTTPIIRTQNTLDIRSVYRADQYGIDDLRSKEIRRRGNQNDTDLPTDNDVFVVLSTVVAQLAFVRDQTEFSAISGFIPQSTSFNLLLSPKRNLLRAGAFLKSMFFGKNDEGQIIFQSSDKNSELSTTNANGTVVERDPINIKDLPERLFYPFMAEFTAPYSVDIQSLINENPNGLIQFQYLGKQFEGFILGIDLMAGRGGQTTVQLLLSRNNDLSEFIN